MPAVRSNQVQTLGAVVQGSAWRLGLTMKMVALVGALALPARAFNPAAGDWHKSDAAHIRVMTFNIEDGIGVGVSTTPARNRKCGLLWRAEAPGAVSAT